MNSSSAGENSLGETIFHWEYPEITFAEKGPKWFLTFGVLLLLFVIYGLWSNDFLMVVVIVLGAGLYYLIYNQDPLRAQFSICALGLQVGPDRFRYGDFKNFWIIENDHVRTLNFDPQKNTRPVITIPLENQDSNHLREYLRLHLTEVTGQEEPWVDKLIRRLKL